MKRGIAFQKAVALVEDTLSITGATTKAGMEIHTYVVQIMETMYDMGFKAAKKQCEEREFKSKRYRG